MTIYFSPSQNIFLDGDLKESYEKGTGWHDDAVAIDDCIFIEFIQLPPSGKIRGVGPDGMPCWIDKPLPTKEELILAAQNSINKLIVEANNNINNKQWPSKLALGRLTDADKAEFNKWLDYIDALEAVDVSTAPDISFPALP